MSPETALDLVGRYARLTLAIKDCKRRIGAELDKCKGLKGFRLEAVVHPGFDGGPEVGFISDYREMTQRASNDQDTHLKYWYEKPGAEDDWGEYRRYVISDEEADECAHCFAAHLIVRERRALRLQLGHVKGAMTRLGGKP